MTKRLWIFIITIIIIVIASFITHDANVPVEEAVESAEVEQLEVIKLVDLPVKEEKVVVAPPPPEPVVAPKPAPVVAQVPPGNCHDWMNQAGVPANLQPDLYALIMRESGCNPGIFNPTSSAGGIPQALPFSKMGCSTTDPVCQIKWMVNYCNVRYGGIVQANIFQINNNWY